MVLSNGHPEAAEGANDLLADTISSNSLWLNPAIFIQDEFDVDETIADFRRYVPLNTLSNELLNYLATLKTKLVEVVNEDYSDYVSLSTRMVNVDGAVLRMRKPLLDLKEKTVVVHDAVKSELQALNQGLKKRKDVGVARGLLELLQDVAHVGQKVEKLLAEVESSSNMADADSKDGLDSSSRMLERVAGEVSRLSFLAAQGKDLAFVKAMEPRVSAARADLEARLAGVLCSALQQQHWPAVLHCLNAFAELGEPSRAEALVREVLVAPLVQRLIQEHKHAIQHSVDGEGFSMLLTSLLANVKSELGPVLEASLGPQSGLHVFNFLGNSVLAELARQIAEQLPGAFSPGIPAAFHANYHSALHFTSSLESMCCNRVLVDKFRNSPAYVEFFKKWNLQVYFSIIFNEVAGKLEAAVQQPGLQQQAAGTAGSTQLHLASSQVLWECLQQCLGSKVFISHLADRFLKLELQLLARYTSWLQQINSSRKTAGTGGEAELPWAAQLSLEELAVPMADVETLASMLRNQFIPSLLRVIPSVTPEVAESLTGAVEESINGMKQQHAVLLGLLVEEVADKCVIVVNQLKGISATYRVTSKGPPTHHSYYVTGALKDLKACLDMPVAASWSADCRSAFLHKTLESVTDRYQQLADELLTTVRKRELSLKRLKKTRAGEEPAGDVNTMSDSDKIGLQLYLDVQEYGRQMQALGCEPANLPPYQKLWEVVAPAGLGQAIAL